MKKLLVATSALVVAGPAFANDVTLSGTFAGKYSTEDASELSGAAITTATLKLSYENENGFGGNITLGDDDLNSSDKAGRLNDAILQVTDINIYADTTLGKFNIGTGDGTMTDSDLTEMNRFNDADTNVAFSSGLTGENLNNDLNADSLQDPLASYLTYSNSFGPVEAAITWAEDGYILSGGLSVGGFDLDLDYSSGRSGSVYTSLIEEFGSADPEPDKRLRDAFGESDASYVINAVGSLAGITVELEYGTGKDEKGDLVDSAYDLYLAYDLGVAKLALGTASNSDQEVEVSGDLGDFGYKLYFGNGEDLNEKSYTGFEVSTQVGAVEAGLKTSDVDGTTSTELYLIPVSGFEIELVDSGKDKEDPVINFKVAASF